LISGKTFFSILNADFNATIMYLFFRSFEPRTNTDLTMCLHAISANLEDVSIARKDGECPK